MTVTRIAVADGAVHLDVRQLGSGPVLVLLPGIFGLEPSAPVVETLAETHRVVVPTIPGFAGSPRPAWCDSVADLMYLSLDLVAELALTEVTLMGCSLGGWVAAQLAVLRPAWLARLVLVDAVGIRVGGREDRDIADVFAIDQDRLIDLAFCDRRIGESHLGVRDRRRTELERIAVDQEALVAYGWQPYLHDPKLRRRLARIDVPTLVVWGAQDGIVSVDYGRAFSDAIPAARFASIADAGHMPHIERPAEFCEALGAFVAASTDAEPMREAP